MIYGMVVNGAGMQMGSKKYKHYYINGEKHGIQLGWYGDGSKKYKHYYINGEKHGIQLGWYGDGSKKYKHYYINGKQRGKQNRMETLT